MSSPSLETTLHAIFAGNGLRKAAKYLGKEAQLEPGTLLSGADAQRAAACDPTNWKAHWRTGLSLMMMAPRLERSEQAIAAFERTCACPTLPESEKQNAKEALNRAKYRLEQGKDALDMPDMSSKSPAMHSQ